MSRDRILADLEALARTNPLHVWRTLAEECGPGEPLPGWVQDYLRKLACGLLDLADQLAPTEAAEQAVGLFGLDRAVFADYRAAREDAAVAAEYEHRLGREPGTSESLLKRASKARGEGRATLFRRLDRARKRWDAQK